MESRCLTLDCWEVDLVWEFKEWSACPDEDLDAPGRGEPELFGLAGASCMRIVGCAMLLFLGEKEARL